METILLQRITEELGLQWPWPEDAWAAVKDMDARILAAEVEVLGYPGPTDWLKHKPDHALVEATKDMAKHCRAMLDPEHSIKLYRGLVNRSMEHRG